MDPIGPWVISIGPQIQGPSCYEHARDPGTLGSEVACNHRRTLGRVSYVCIRGSHLGPPGVKGGPCGLLDHVE
jgi:hypothetical protein